MEAARSRNIINAGERQGESQKSGHLDSEDYEKESKSGWQLSNQLQSTEIASLTSFIISISIVGYGGVSLSANNRSRPRLRRRHRRRSARSPDGGFLDLRDRAPVDEATQFCGGFL
uniref:Uncharacterized protein n=1 Tax=Macrostomum lignano TaxID=282301 RepID=A0A1I8F9W3_9PLAT